ncbi:hypothetical protein KMW28_15230 [Flammeovirga yaeyamensis]|uniref:Uncharacterized protein n=1 Tax=Flammeovirga yaeyamensis TaxID=367791 RepID=A0AAX1N0A1_9BACT|nr:MULTISPECIES: hypothetical protein [Flammeovirga]ANQ47596.1 hypothetical protein MY04_0214 [Flammeovirga sp. MY04]MBB3698639.1 hypothetical protein [Flammeovirga yaeyamensis]NMF34015.1 hypothetical protein [Flammeovirga yaeyamensis]QWG01003.1 hypothetical protein KMW28_15230 [Flammeovirga yaeyamensis]
MKTLLTFIAALLLFLPDYANDRPIKKYDDANLKIYTHASAAGTAAYIFQDNGNVTYVLDYRDGSYYEYPGQYSISDNQIKIDLQAGKGKNNMGIEMSQLIPKRKHIELQVQSEDVIFDDEHFKHGRFELLENQKAK